MKECPVCKAIAFDDAQVCYGCLHRFEPGEGAMSAVGNLGHGGDSGSADAAQAIPLAPQVLPIRRNRWLRRPRLTARRRPSPGPRPLQFLKHLCPPPSRFP